MYQGGFLPAVGPTIPKAPVNLTEKTGGILNELEKAHAYIEHLHAKMLALEARLAAIDGGEREPLHSRGLIEGPIRPVGRIGPCFCVAEPRILHTEIALE